MATDTIVRVDPKTLLVGPNVRKEITLPAEFVASVKEHGVKIPIVAHETKDGLEVVDGQMRTLAALDAGLTEVPVFIRPTVEGGERLVEQLVVNRERTSLSRKDTIAAVRELTLDFKMPAAAVAKKVGISAADVKSVLAIAKSPTASAIDLDQVDLSVAAKIAEAELTKKQAGEVLQYPRQAEHKLQQILDERAEKALVAELEKAAKAEGLTLVARPKPEYSSEPANKHRYLVDLVDKETGAPVEVIAHKDCPGHAAFVGKRGGYAYNEKVELRLVCTDPAKYGHRDGRRTAPTPLTDKEKAERKVAVERGKLWPSITTVRTTWIREQLLTRKTMPPAWEQLVARVKLGVINSATDSYRWSDLAHELLQVTKKGYGAGAIVDELEAKPARAEVLLVGIAIAQIEQYLSDKAGWKFATPMYLQLLEAWGYKLSELEQELVVASEKKGAKVA